MNYIASAAAMVDHVAAIADGDDCPGPLRERLRTLRSELSSVEVVAFFRALRDSALHYAPQHIAASFGGGGDRVLLELRRSLKAHRTPKAEALRYIARGDALGGVELTRARDEHDALLDRFRTSARRAIQEAFAREIAEYRVLERELATVHGIAYGSGD